MTSWLRGIADVFTGLTGLMRCTSRGPLTHTNVYLTPGARKGLAKLDAARREALTDGFRRVGWELLSSAKQVEVEAGWARRTWPRRRYPQQCYAKTLKYVVDHPDITGMRLTHGVVSHTPHLAPFDHAWVELPGDVVFDGVVQTFFTHASYYSVMAAVALDSYSVSETTCLISMHRHPGPWNAKWVPTPVQLTTYVAAVRAGHDVASGSTGPHSL